MLMMMMMIVKILFSIKDIWMKKSSPRPLNNWKIIDEIKERKKREISFLFLIFYMVERQMKMILLLGTNSIILQ